MGSRTRNLLETGQATFKIGRKTAEVGREDTGWERETIFNDMLDINGVRKKMVFDNKHRIGLAPTNIKTKIKKLDRNKIIVFL